MDNFEKYLSTPEKAAPLLAERGFCCCYDLRGEDRPCENGTKPPYQALLWDCEWHIFYYLKQEAEDLK